MKVQKMNTLFVAWQAPSPSRAWFPIGRLSVSETEPKFEFQYTQGALQAKEQAGFSPLLAFPDFERRYESPELFPLFRNRVLEPTRKDFAEYLGWLNLSPVNADPIQILGLTGGERQTDSLEVFPKMQKRTDGTVSCRFFLHGLRHVPQAAQARAQQLKVNECLQVAVEINNPVTGHALQLQTQDGHLIGWAPRYLVDDLATAALRDPASVTAKVLRVNGMDAPPPRRVLIEICGRGALNAEPMNSEQYSVLAG